MQQAVDAAAAAAAAVAALCAQLSHKLNQILPRVTLFAAAAAAAACQSRPDQWQMPVAGGTKLSADFGYDCRLINAIRNNKQARSWADPSRSERGSAAEKWND